MAISKKEKSKIAVALLVLVLLMVAKVNPFGVVPVDLTPYTKVINISLWVWVAAFAWFVIPGMFLTWPIIALVAAALVHTFMKARK